MAIPKTFPLLATIMMLCGVAVLCTLGLWQVDRLEWKEGLLTTIEAQRAEPERIFTAASLSEDNEFQSGTLRGKFLNDKSINLVPRTYDGKSGAHIITPFQIANGIVILVNRGWVKLGETDTTLASPRTITGMIRIPQAPNAFTPHNDTSSDEWYRIEYTDFETAHNLDNIAPVMLYEACADEINSNAPNPCALTLNINNNHLQYAFFWFAMAAVLIVIYGLRFWFMKPRGT